MAEGSPWLAGGPKEILFEKPWMSCCLYDSVLLMLGLFGADVNLM